MRARPAALLLCGALLAGGCGGEPATRLRLATTTSTANSGLLPWLLEPFESASGIAVDVLPVGTGQALALGRRGDADLVLVHDRAREDEAVASGWAVERRDVMWNDFLLLGPPADPAGAREAGTAAEALQRIARAGAAFVSRGDDSGTHAREKALWGAGGGRPPWEGYLEAGQGMGACLTMADEKEAYVLSDRGTWLAFRTRLDLVVVSEGDEALHNPYGVLLLDPGRYAGVHHEEARRLADWLTSPEGQARIAAFRVEEAVLFHPTRVE